MKRFITGLGIGLLFACAYAIGQGQLADQATSMTLYDENGNAFTFPDTTGPVIVNSTEIMVLKDEFPPSVASGEIGELGWNVFDGSAVVVLGETNHPGIVENLSDAGSGDESALFLKSSTSLGYIVPTDVANMTFILRVNDTADLNVWVGILEDVDSDTPTDGVWFEFRPGTSANWVTVTESADTQTANTTSVAVGTDWHKLEMVRLSNGNWEFYIADVLQFTHSTNLPTVASSPTFTVEKTTATNKSIDVDYFSMTSNVLTR